MESGPQSSKKAPHTEFQVLFFVLSLCLICALILAVTAYSLENAQQNAKEFDQSKQMLIAAKILNHAGYFELLAADGSLTQARFDAESQMLVVDPAALKATEEQIKKVAQLRIIPLLTDKEGNIYTLEEKKVTLPDYLAENKKRGYANLPLKLFYAILPNEKVEGKEVQTEVSKDISKISIFVIPISGFGLWAPIYGYLAVGKDGASVIGTTWYEHGETPGLGANITEPWWQRQFYKKLIFQESPGGSTDFQTADMGIIVVKGKVADVFGSAPKAKSAVDGMSGATLTGDGVTAAYRNSLTPYRSLLLKVHQETTQGTKNG
jgi:Na+-transporting NADH:ubiquinone oxidoreductase subunit C